MALNYYRLLGIPPDSGQRRIKSAYRSLAKRFHPDRNSGSETAAELFRQVNHAYRVLSDPKLRTLYDQKLSRQDNLDKQQSSTKTNSARLDPQQKFNNFVKSLLDALFGSVDTQVEPSSQQRNYRTKNPTRQVEKPAFNFHYNLAVEKNKTPYMRGEDGIFRKTQQKNQNKR
ncbi:MAG: DnaJ domain-containing protein [Desulfuromusa sp.]|nr:DnaJ domain-containing protein [Desulfuromusa sp.]